MRSHVGLVSKGVLLLAGALLSVNSFALDPTYFQGQAPKAEDAVTPYGTDLFGDQINLYDGSLQFNQTDLTIKGNSDLPVTLSRSAVPGKNEKITAFGKQLGDWKFDVPRIGGTFSVLTGWRGYDGSYSRCSKYNEPASESVRAGGSIYTVFPVSFWHGTFLEVPGQSNQELLPRATGYTSAPQNSPSTYPIVTKGNWAIKCAPTTIKNGSGEGFTAISPNGVTYVFDWLGSRTVDSVKISSSSLARQEVYLYATKVTDRFGNWVTYTYDPSYPNALQSIQSNDGRTITVTNSSGKATSATDGTRTYHYAYGSAGDLETVTLPDSSQWQFALANMSVNTLGLRPTEDCDDGSGQMQPGTYSGTVVHPSGASAVFNTQFVAHSFAGAPTTCNPSDGVMRMVYPPVSVNLSLTSKSISGPGIATMNWSYAYQDYTDCSTNCYRTVTVTEPTPTTASAAFETRHRFGIQWHATEGQLQGIDAGWDGSSSALRTTNTTYNPYSGQTYPASFGNSFIQDTGDYLASRNTPLQQQVITQQGQTFSAVYGVFDGFARPTTVTRSGTGGSRSETTTYSDNYTSWTMGQVHTVTAGTGTGCIPANNGCVMVDYEYDPTWATQLSEQHFAGPITTKTYNNTDGTLATKSDGAGNTISYSSYMRGIAQTVTYPTYSSYPTHVTETGTVNNIGRITKYTDPIYPTGNVYSFGYDAMGRLASITPPSGFTGTSVVFASIPSVEYGLAAGHWRQTVTKGNATTLRYFDALWRPVMTRSYDAANVAATTTVVVKGYGVDMHPSFESYPQNSTQQNVLSTSPGSRMQYDAIGRLIQTIADSELGNLTSSVAYLNGFQTQGTDPRGYVTTQSLWALDNPDESSISSIAAPEGVQVAFTRDAFGKTTLINRNGVTRAYVYDSGQRLCKTIAPETSSTVQNYDAAGNVAWKAVGQALPDPNACNYSNVLPSGQITFGYDALGQLTSTTYGDGSPSITRTFWPDEKLNTVTSNGSTWTYNYNGLRQLEGETLSYSAQTFPFTWIHDSLGNLSTSSNPAGSISYVPNALGQATQVGTYATGVTYWPNGGVAGYTLGNQIVHSQTQTTRGQPLVNSDGAMLNDSYTYDQNGNVASITDNLPSGNLPNFTRTMAPYDGLNRLKGVTAANVWGVATFSYDTVDNMTTVTSNGGSRVITLNYNDGTNRLTGLTQSGTTMPYTYDSHGNINSRGPATFTFDLGNRLVSSNQGGGYVYDGLGRRVQVQSTDGSTRLQVYGQAGQLLWSTNTGGGRATSWTQYFYLADKEIAENNNVSGTEYVHVDALGSPVAHSNQAGALISQTRFEAYGNPAQGTVPGPSASIVGFTGHVQDPESELVYMQQRYYDVASSRFLSVDPLTTDADSGRSFNLYEYAQSNPYQYVDPDGRDPKKEAPDKVIQTPVTGSHIKQVTTVSSTGVVTTAGPAGTSATAAQNALNSWGRADTLTDHFERHGPDFGAKDEADYASKASQFKTDALNNLSSELRVSNDGIVRLYDPATNTFGSYNPDGTTKTFYKPIDGRPYWDVNAPRWGDEPGKVTAPQRSAWIQRSIRFMRGFRGAAGEE